MQRGELLYAGKSKRVFQTVDPAKVILEFTDEATAFNAEKRATVSGKGEVNCLISAALFDLVHASGVQHHMIELLSDTEMLCHAVEIVPVEVIVRNRAAGSFTKRYGIEEGEPFSQPLVELCYKSDAHGDPPVNEDAVVELGWASRAEVQHMAEEALRIHAVLGAYWETHNLDLIDAKYEFGRSAQGLVLADELTPDGARLWEKGTMRRFDKDVFRRDLGDLGDTYRELLARVRGS